MMSRKIKPLIDSIRSLNLGFSIYLYVLVGSLAVLYLLFYHVYLVSDPLPAEYREGAMLITTQALSDRVDIYAWESQPFYANMYGFLYNVVVVPVAASSIPDLAAHRLVSAVFILLCVLLVFYASVRLGASRVLSFLAASILYATLLTANIPFARPDSMGLFLFLLSLFVVYWERFSLRSLVVVTFLAILSFFTKAYFVIVLPLVSLYLFMFVSKRTAVIFSVCWVFVLASLVVMFSIHFDSYFVNTFLLISMSNEYSIVHMLIQTIAFFLINLGFVILLVWVNVSLFLQQRASSSWNWRHLLRNRYADLTGLAKKLNLRNFDAPLLSSRMDFLLVILLVLSGLVILYLGLNTGAFLTYYFSLISPLLVVVMARFGYLSGPDTVSRGRNHFHVAGIVLSANLVLVALLLVPSVADLNSDSVRQALQYHEDIVYHNEKVLASAAMSSILIRADQTVYDTGLSEYYLYLDPTIYTREGPFDHVYVPVEVISDYSGTLNDLIETQFFDVLVLKNGQIPYVNSSVIREHYVLVDRVDFPMPASRQNVAHQVYRPRNY